MLSAIPTPTIPNRVFKITSYGATASSADNTADIQACINAASKAGGGIVEIPAASQDWECGPITLANNIDLQIDAGATLQMLPYGTYPLTQGATSYANFIEGSHLSNIEISGAGTIDGNGSPWWTVYNNGTLTVRRPQMIAIDSCNIVLIEGLTLTNPPNTHISLQNTCNDCIVQNITINSPASSPNTDGIDVSGTNMLFQNLNIADGDDNIAIGAGATSGGPETANITITNCTFGVGHGLSIGSYTSGGVQNVSVSNCTFNGTTSGIRLKSERGRGGAVSNISYYNITMTNVEYAIDINSYYEAAVPSNPMDPPQNVAETPVWQNITISNVTSVTSSSQSNYSGSYCGIIWGLPEAPVNGVILSNVHLTARYGFDLDHDTNVAFDAKCTITPLGGGGAEISTNSSATPYEVTVDEEGYGDQDIGSPATAGDTLFNPNTDLWTITAGGTGIGGSSDQFNLMSENETGNATYSAKVTSETNAGSAGVMLRDSSDTGTSAFAAALVTPGSGVEFVWRLANGGTVGSASVSGIVAPVYLEIVRSGSSFSAFYSSNGTSWTQIGTAETVTMSNTALMGLAVAANSSSTTTVAGFSNVAGATITTDPAASPQPVTGSTANLSVAASESGSSLTYTWSVLSEPSGVTTPTFSTNGLGTSNNTTATFFAPGVYEFLATVTDSNGVSSSAVLGVGVNQTATSVTVSPATATLGADGVQLFAATAKDQFGATFEPLFSWSSTGGGSVNSSFGLFTNTPAINGSATVKATAGSVSGTANVVLQSFAQEFGSTLDVYLSASGAVSLANSGANVAVTQNGTQLSYSGVTQILVSDSASGDTLNFNGPLAVPLSFTNAASSIVNVNSGTMTLAAVPGGAINLGALAIAANANAVLAASTTPQPTTLNLGSLSIGSGGHFDVTNNVVFIDYGTGADPIATIAGYLASGYGGGSWSAAGIDSSIAATQNATYGVGYADSADAGDPANLPAAAIKIMYTLLGDANLDGVVDGTDLGIVSANFNKGVTGWDQGDFNYDNVVDGTDFGDVAGNFNQGLNIDAGVEVGAPATASPSTTTSPSPLDSPLATSPSRVNTRHHPTFRNADSNSKIYH